MDDERVNKFLDELTALSHKHGLGITDGGVLFELESEDTERRYSCDDASNLEFT